MKIANMRFEAVSSHRPRTKEKVRHLPETEREKLRRFGKIQRLGIGTMNELGIWRRFWIKDLELHSSGSVFLRLWLKDLEGKPNFNARQTDFHSQF
jgi:hypothetical protein